MSTTAKKNTNGKSNSRRQNNSKNPTVRNRREQQDYWTMLKEAFGIKPDEVDAQMTMRTLYYKDQLLNIAKGRFNITCPDDWDKDYMLDLLLLNGKFFITNTIAGILPLKGSAYGLNVFNRPTNVTIVNPVLPTMERIFKGENADASVIYLYDTKIFRNIIPLLDKYSQKLANIDCSQDVGLINIRLPYIFNVEDSAQAAEAKLVYDKVTRGEPAIFTKMKNPLKDGDTGVEITGMPIKDTYVFDKLVEARRAIMSDFLTELGLSSNPYEKKERLISAEVDSYTEEVDANVSYIKKNLEEGNKQTKKLFPDLNFKVELEVMENEQKETENFYKESSKSDANGGDSR